MRYKLGIIVPSWNTMMEYETQRMAQPGTSIHSMRIAHTADAEENNFGTLDLIEALEKKLDKPVVTSNRPRCGR